MTFSPVKILLPALLAVLAGCSSTSEQDKQIEAIAKHRASVLSASLPVEHGPLTVMQAKSRGKVVELMMLYNGEKPPASLMNSSINFYCTNAEIKANLEMGVEYQIKMRNSRGQLLVEQHISSQNCKESK